MFKTSNRPFDRRLEFYILLSLMSPNTQKLRRSRTINVFFSLWYLRSQLRLSLAWNNAKSCRSPSLPLKNLLSTSLEREHPLQTHERTNVLYSDKSSVSYSNLLSHIWTPRASKDSAIWCLGKSFSWCCLDLYSYKDIEAKFSRDGSCRHGVAPVPYCQQHYILQTSASEIITTETLFKFIQRVILVELIMTIPLPEQFALVSNGSTGDSVHNVGIFLRIPASSRNGYNTAILGFSHVEEDTTLNAEEQTFFSETNFENVRWLIGDNCFNKKSIQTNWGMSISTEWRHLVWV